MRIGLLQLPRVGFWRVVCVAVGLLLAKVAYDWLTRPVFFTVYGRHEFAVLPHWIYPPCSPDAHGSFCMADARLNLLLIVIAPDQAGDEYQYKIPYSSILKSANTSGATVRYEPNDERTAAIPRATDRCFLVLPDYSVLDAPLEPNQADHLCENLDQGGISRRGLLGAMRQLIPAGQYELLAMLDAAESRVRDVLPASQSAGSPAGRDHRPPVD